MENIDFTHTRVTIPLNDSNSHCLDSTIQRRLHCSVAPAFILLNLLDEVLVDVFMSVVRPREVDVAEIDRLVEHDGASRQPSSQLVDVGLRCQRVPSSVVKARAWVHHVLNGESRRLQGAVLDLVNAFELRARVDTRAGITVATVVVRCERVVSDALRIVGHVFGGRTRGGLRDVHMNS